MQHNRTLQNQPTALDASLSAGDEIITDSDEPPDERNNILSKDSPSTPVVMQKFEKTTAPQFQRKESLLTQALQMSGSGSHTEDERRSSSRGLSNASIWSNTSAASMAELTSGLTSPCTRPSSPSPPLPPANFGSITSHFKKEPFNQNVVVSHDDQENISPLQKTPSVAPDEKTVEATLGRRRCITFACGKKDQNKTENIGAPKAQENGNTAGPLKRPTTIKFACPARVSTEDTKAGSKPAPTHQRSPSQIRKTHVSPKPSSRSHRGSDSTVRNDSPKSVRKAPSFGRNRRLSVNSDLDRTEATRFHEFASSEEEVEEWTQESTCHKSRLTVNDTLKVENGLRQLAEEVEEEVLEDEEEDEELADEDDEDEDEDEELEEDVNEWEEGVEEDVASVDAYESVSDAGFDTDDEEGFAESDDESDAGSDYNWWAPGQSTAATSLDPPSPGHIRPTSGRRSISDSSIGSVGSTTARGPARIRKLKPRPRDIFPNAAELPDSTDFVCGTLDEDRPLEEAYISNMERRRAAKHKITPQDIDPTFPASDPEMDEEDEVDEFEHIVEESDNHLFLHGQPEDEGDLRGRRPSGQRAKASPLHSPRRLRSPPPAKRTTTHRSPPPRRLFGQSPKRLCSPPPPARLKSPPGTRNTSITTSPSQQPQLKLRLSALAERPQITQSSSLPRTPTVAHQDPLEDADDTSKDGHRRGAIDIFKGLEKKRQRRKEKLHQKHCRKNGKDKERRPPPGKGVKCMREMGLELHAYNKGKSKGPWDLQKVHMLSY